LLEFNILKKLIFELGFLITFGPFEIEGNLNSAAYSDLSVTKVGPWHWKRWQEKIWKSRSNKMDGCFLNDSFPNCWIGRVGAINWPARSSDLAPCDFFLWGHLKVKIYKKRLPDITAECALITERQLPSVRNAFYNRSGYCLFQNGGLFEY
jgi:hypothetical protein